MIFADTPSPELPDWLDYGSKIGVVSLLLLIVAAFVKNWVYTRATYEAMVARAEKAEGQRDALQKVMADEVVPALTRATDQLAEARAEAAVRRRQ